MSQQATLLSELKITIKTLEFLAHMYRFMMQGRSNFGTELIFALWTLKLLLHIYRFRWVTSLPFGFYVKISDAKICGLSALQDIRTLNIGTYGSNIWIFYMLLGFLYFFPIHTDLWWAARLPFWVNWWSQSGHWNFWPICTELWWVTRLPFRVAW